MSGLYLGIDVSTTAVKALLCEADGAVRAVESTPLSVETPRPLWSEQDPAQWWRATLASLRAVLSSPEAQGREVRAVGLTGQMHGLVLLDDAGAVVRPAILWNDQRTGAECDEIRERMGGRDALVRLTGNDALTGFTAPKALWVRRHEPEAWSRARRILLPKDYVRFRLTGEYAMDKADGSGTLLFDLGARDWSNEVLSRLEIPRAWLPPTFEGPEITGRVTEDVARETGLKAGLPVMAGGGDQAAGAVGTGAVAPGVLSLTLGTSGVLFATTPGPLVEPHGRLHAFCHAAPGLWHFMGVTLAAAGSLQWYRDTLAPGEPFDALVREAEEAPAGSEGLLFTPYLSGERTPYPDPLVRASFVGLTTRHRRAHMTRAVLEGVACSMRDCFDLLRAAGLANASQVRIAGGGARSALWRRIIASVLDLEVVTVNAAEGAAYGAALLASVGDGAFPDVGAACARTVRVTSATAPEREWVKAYEDACRRYRSLYPALKPVFDAV